MAGKVAAETVSVNPAVGFSCGAAVEGGPRRQPWVEVLASEPRSGERKSSWAGILSPLTGLVVMAHFSPRLAPWATLFRHTVADSLRTHCKNLTCASLAPPKQTTVGF